MTHLVVLQVILKIIKMMSSIINSLTTFQYDSSSKNYKYQGTDEAIQLPRQNGQNDAEKSETKHGEMNIIPEAKSDLDMSDMVTS